MTNHGQVPATVDIAVELQADFADIFEIHGSSIAAPPGLALALASRDYALRFDFRDAGLRWTTLVKSSVEPRHEGNCFTMT